jgi:hypothetical protein
MRPLHLRTSVQLHVTFPLTSQSHSVLFDAWHHLISKKTPGHVMLARMHEMKRLFLSKM